VSHPNRAVAYGTQEMTAVLLASMTNATAGTSAPKPGMLRKPCKAEKGLSRPKVVRRRAGGNDSRSRKTAPNPPSAVLQPAATKAYCKSVRPR
jgi:hypothetical protein